MNPLQRIPSLKLKLGLVIVMAIVVTLATMVLVAELGLRMRWGVPIALVAALVAVQIVARGMTAPLRAMAQAAEAMARGQHGQRVEVRGIDEVAQLAQAFNGMAAELEQLDRTRRDFVADAAHELRTPVSALRAQLENAVDGVEELDPGALLAQVERLGRLTDQLLDLSRLEAGGSALRPRTFVVADLVDGYGVPVDVPVGLQARGDPDRLAQVVTNLVDNARRHGGGAPVALRARARPHGGVRLEIEDRGPGLAREDAERLFDRFARADRSRSTTGFGLGLAISRSIVELHGGSLRAEAAEPHGCRMVVELP